MSHYHIEKHFKLGDRSFGADGFLDNGGGFLGDGEECSVPGDIAIQRVPDVINDDDERHICEHLQSLPENLRSYKLMSSKACYDWVDTSVQNWMDGSGYWRRSCNYLKEHWGADVLVLRQDVPKPVIKNHVGRILLMVAAAALLFVLFRSCA